MWYNQYRCCSGAETGTESPEIGTESPENEIQNEKSAIELLKAAIQKQNYNAQTVRNIEKLYSSIETDQVFGSADVKRILDCSDSTARAIIAKLRNELKVIVAVKGHGKAKYRITSGT